ncbi:hypothetical protein [Filimonas effusa]|uniref:Uncharacterized protein n=1 Tax=Filimonas effusa TaxID=2508721 RepID=A0A4Q1D7C9_9BACT|nr:hypothetical protein [Filimonas effusa]RXK83597.1 hypothetical protein ESB13_16045 [Filimonas effusa]
MKKLLVPMILLLYSCRELPKEMPADTAKIADSSRLMQASKPDTAQDQLYTSDLRPDRLVPLEKIFVDTVTYVDFSGDGDYMLCFIRKSSQLLSLVCDNVPEGKLNFLRGDTLEIKWKMDSIWIAGEGERLDFAEWLTNVRKIKDGKVEAFRKSNPKPIKYWHAREKSYGEDFKDYLYRLVEYYIAYSEKELVKAQLHNAENNGFVYSIEEMEKNDRHYTVLGLSVDRGTHSNIIQWLYLDSETRLFYEYDPATDKLVEFK